VVAREARCVSDHPVCAAKEALRSFLTGAATPPYEGGDYTRPTHLGQFRGFSLLEVLVSMTLFATVLSGLASLFTITIPSSSIDQMNVQLLHAARAKVDQLESIPYYQLGIAATADVTSGPAYLETDPIYNPEYDPSKDHLLSDVITLPNGLTVTRTVTVTAVDDPADGTGSADADQIHDPNTNTVMDYKSVTVVATATSSGINLKLQLTTILRGDLTSEINAATGEDSSGDEIPPAPGKSRSGFGPPDPPPLKYDTPPTDDPSNPQPRKGLAPGQPGKTGSSIG
jgi:prepilin-type N-terminal cleavage/methylation domain-containing protein